MRRNKRVASGLLLSMMLSFNRPDAASAAPGDLDPTFGGGGKVTTDFGGHDVASALALQSDGKIVVSGTSETDFALARYNSDGGLDASFGNAGKVTTGFTAGGMNEAHALALQADGKLVVAGQSCVTSNCDFALARYNPDGSLDAVFGNGGRVINDLGGADNAFALALQQDAKIVVAGRGGLLDFALARYHPDGSSDATFGIGGNVTTDFGGSATALALTLQADGRLVVAGQSCVASNCDFALARYNADGSLDASFGGGGKVITDLGGIDAAGGLALQPDGKIVVAGWSCASAGGANCDFALTRYNPDGSLDTSFGNAGKVTTDVGADDRVPAVALQADGKIVVAGWSHEGLARNFAVARYNSDGSPDTSFGSGGKVTTDFGFYDDFGSALALQPDGKIVMVGSSGPCACDFGGDFALARYRADPMLFVGLTLNDFTPMPGELLEIGTREANSGPDTYVDKYLGALLSPEVGPAFGCPGFDAVVFVTETLGLFLTCLSAPPQSFPPFAHNVLIPADLALTVIDNVFSVAWPAGAPGGIYTLFMAYIASGSVADGVLDPGDLLAVGAATVTATP